MQNNVCPCCGRHCAHDALNCRRGMEYFGVEMKEEDVRQHSHGHGRPETAKNPNAPIHEKILMELRECGHYLHHNFGHGNAPDSEALMSALSKEEQAELLHLLQKCRQGWHN